MRIGEYMQRADGYDAVMHIEHTRGKWQIYTSKYVVINNATVDSIFSIKNSDK